MYNSLYRNRRSSLNWYLDPQGNGESLICKVIIDSATRSRSGILEARSLGSYHSPKWIYLKYVRLFRIWFVMRSYSDSEFRGPYWGTRGSALDC